MPWASSFIVSWIRYASHYSLCYFIKHSWETQICLLAQTYEKWPQEVILSLWGGKLLSNTIWFLWRSVWTHSTWQKLCDPRFWKWTLWLFRHTSQSSYLSFSSSSVWENAPKHPFCSCLTDFPGCTWPVTEQLTRLHYPASGRARTYQSLNYTKKYEAQALLSKNNWSGNLIVPYAAAVLSPWHHWTSGSSRKHFLPPPLLSATDSYWCIMFCVINTIHFVWWQALFEHGPVNVYGAAEESKECCNNPPRPVRYNQPFWSTTAQQKQTHKAGLSWSHKQHLRQVLAKHMQEPTNQALLNYLTEGWTDWKDKTMLSDCQPILDLKGQ